MTAALLAVMTSRALLSIVLLACAGCGSSSESGPGLTSGEARVDGASGGQTVTYGQAFYGVGHDINGKEDGTFSIVLAKAGASCDAATTSGLTVWFYDKDTKDRGNVASANATANGDATLTPMPADTTLAAHGDISSSLHVVFQDTTANHLDGSFVATYCKLLDGYTASTATK
jgi:hypothetical protein